MPNTRQQFGPPYFSLPTTVNLSIIVFFNDEVLLLLLLPPVLQVLVVLGEKALL
jgi:hypothetical protein